jgi:hypothetical protein
MYLNQNLIKMNTMINQKRILKIFTILVLTLFLNLPIISALEISGVGVRNITQDSVEVVWETDEPADSFVNYGTTRDQLESTGDGDEVEQHNILLNQLSPGNEYLFSVESNGVSDDNGEEYYLFKTLPLDDTAPTLDVEVEEFVKGNQLDVQGTTETGAIVKVYVDGTLWDSVRAESAEEEAGKTPTGEFMFNDVIINKDVYNNLTVESTDPSGNVVVWSTLVLSDTQKPQLTLEEFPELISETTYEVVGTATEECDYEFFVNDKSAVKGKGTEIKQRVTLQEGKNNIKIVLTDKVGWETTKKFVLKSDTMPPTVKFELANGAEYYEGRAQTDINGETEPGAKVFLYVYNSRTNEYQADFSKALMETTAGDDGKFKFNNVKFPPPAFLEWKDLAPREVPSGLQEVLIPNLAELGSQERKTYYIYVIAEDDTGKVGNAPSRTVNVNTCYSANFAFDISPLPEFQAPFRLDPTLMEDGRETIQAVFNLTYRGTAIPDINPVTKEEMPGYRISSVQFNKACTRNTAANNDYELGCKLIPASLRAQPNGDKTAYYVTSKLMAADFTERDDEVWDDYVSNRRLKFPLKIAVNYQEKENNNAWGQTKTQVLCYDLGYFVDIPIKSSELVPDFLANQGVALLNKTIDAINKIEPYFRTAMLATGVACIGSFLFKMVTRFYRNFMSHFEEWTTKTKVKEEQCPNPKVQRTLFIESTVDNWEELEGQRHSGDLRLPEKYTEEENSLKELCPQTASAWQFESAIDQAYRWTCDRFLCRSVPARWTEGAEEQDVKNVIVKQQQCDATTSCAYLQRKENCQEIAKRNVAKLDLIPEDPTFHCWYNPLNGIHYVEPKEGVQISENLFKLNRITSNTDIGNTKTFDEETILVFKPEGADSFCIASTKSCENVCKSNTGYKAVSDGYKLGTGGYTSGGSCYKETGDGLTGTGGSKLTEGKYKAGYTKDCFANENSGEMYQCVCEAVEDSKKGAETSRGDGARVAVKKDGNAAEEWSYRQATIFRESGGNAKSCSGGIAGTCYPSWRYYGGRDLSGAFGANYGLDNFKDSSDFSQMTTTQVNPHTQTLGAFQSVCLPGIFARLQMLKSILTGLKGCIEQAKYSGFQDAGMCKSLFTQYVCGLVYKLISYLGSDCSPLSIKDAEFGLDDSGIQQFFESGFKSIPETIDSSISEVKDDYGNAKVNEFFSMGTQGFTESICLAAFGYDFPMGVDFIMDAAYSFPMATNVFFPLAERELSNYDPIKGSSIHNYHLGGVVLPGCNIRSYRVELKCIGNEDLGNPGVKCGPQGCDCLHVSGAQSPYGGEKVHLVEGGSGFDITKGEMFDIPIPSPQKVASNFRYDHVVLKLTLDQGESAENCFDDGYRTSNGGIFYFPIQDITPPGTMSCYADVASGRFICPDLSSFFGGGNNYFEFPYLQCRDDETEEFVDCDTPNLLLMNDEIIAKLHMNLGNEKACLKIKDDRGIIDRTIELPANHNGPFVKIIPLGTVTDTLLSGGGVGSISQQAGNNQHCETPYVIKRGTVESYGSFDFHFDCAEGKCEIKGLPSEMKVITSGFEIIGGTLKRSSESMLTLDEIKEVEFRYQDFDFKNILDKLADGKGDCKYSIQQSGAFTQRNVATMRVTAELLKPGESENCFTAKVRFPQSGFGKTYFTLPIGLQEKEIEVAGANEIHNDFVNGNYNVVVGKASPIVRNGIAGFEGARAIYYWVASLIMLEGDKVGSGSHTTDIKALLELYFTGQNTNWELDGSENTYIRDFNTDKFPEREKLHVYMCKIDRIYGKRYQSQCDVLNSGSSGGDSTSTARGGCSNYGVRIPEDPSYVYRCLDNCKVEACCIGGCKDSEGKVVYNPGHEIDAFDIPSEYLKLREVCSCP